MKYRIMRMYQDRNHIFLDLYNWEFSVNIELKFLCHGRSHEYKTLINWLVYCDRVRQDVTAEEIIKQYEDISFGKLIDKNNKKGYNGGE